MNLTAVLPLLITAVGIYFIVKLRFFYIIHPKTCFRKALSGNGSDYASLALALAGTLGVGNIVGVGVGILIGGPGSIFWLLVSALFSSAIKYAEVTLAVDSAKRGDCGFIGLVRRSLRGGKFFSLAFALICLLLSLFMGAALQCSSISECAEAGIGIKRSFFLFPILLTVAAAIAGGGKRIEKVVCIIIPLTTIVYIFMCFAIIVLNIEKLGATLLLIVKSAFSTEAAVGGAGGFMALKALREGYSRGILSNEAGAGTSSFAHSRSVDREPFEAGIFGIVEVLFDTVILCTLSGLAVLLPLNSLSGEGGAALVTDAFKSALGDLSGLALFVSIFFFATSTVICWYYYGSVCWCELFGKRCRAFYFILYLLFCAIGVFYSGLSLIFITDILLFLLSVITLTVLIKNRRRVIELTPKSLLGKSNKTAK